jgi:hypothetical protein
MTDISTATIPHYHYQAATLDERVEIPEDAPLAQGHDDDKAAEVKQASDAFRDAAAEQKRVEAERAEQREAERRDQAERRVQGDERQTAQSDQSDQSDEPQSQDDDVPDGSIDDVLGWVGDDHERAQRALEVENEKSSPRTSLVSKLETL